MADIENTTPRRAQPGAMDEHVMAAEGLPPLTRGEEISRVKIFLGVQVMFLGLSAFTGGFAFAWWSMLDSALLIQAIGITALVPVLDELWMRRLAFKAAITCYLLAVADMGLNVVISGVVGWGRLFG